MGARRLGAVLVHVVTELDHEVDLALGEGPVHGEAAIREASARHRSDPQPLGAGGGEGSGAPDRRAGAVRAGEGVPPHAGGDEARRVRSEERTSELTALMRISYAVLSSTNKQHA